MKQQIYKHFRNSCSFTWKLARKIGQENTIKTFPNHAQNLKFCLETIKRVAWKSIRKQFENHSRTVFLPWMLLCSLFTSYNEMASLEQLMKLSRCFQDSRPDEETLEILFMKNWSVFHSFPVPIFLQSYFLSRRMSCMQERATQISSGVYFLTAHQYILYLIPLR